ncbi:hypothetical protein [Sorangium sp. So ce426]
MSSSTDVVSALRVAAALESLGREWFIGGSLGSGSFAASATLGSI